MTYCLRFLCFHHLGNIPNRHNALIELHLSAYDTRCFSNNTASTALTIIGVLYETSGDKDRAYKFYDVAMQQKVMYVFQ